jgi:UMP-CMP kinase family protein
MPEVDGLYVPSTEEPKESESGTMSTLGYWNGRKAWDRADRKSARNPALSYSNSYKAWRLCRLDGHLAYTIENEDELPDTPTTWDVYKKGVAPAPKITVHSSDPREAPNVVFVLGGPGAGKGTMCELAMNQLGWTHLSAGDLLRAERKAGGPDAALIEEYIEAGKIVPVTITVGLIKRAMNEVTTNTGANSFLIDGFPRSLENWDGWQEVFGKDAPMPTMLFFECPLAILEERIMGRAKFSGRSDDNVESLRKRFVTYKEETMPIVDVFREAGKVVDVDSSKDRTEVWDLVKEALKEWSSKDDELTERSQCLLGLIPWPKRDKKSD